jgi:hypothetical protein
MTHNQKIAEGAPRVRGRPFASGNPGRPKGARNKNTLALEALLDGEAEVIIRKVIDMARAGDHVALRLYFERILGPRLERTVSLDLPPIETAQDGAAALASIVAAAAAGRISPAEAATLTQVIQATIAVIATADFERRIEALEKGRFEGIDKGN